MKKIITIFSAILLLLFISFQFFDEGDVKIKKTAISKNNIPKLSSQRKSYVKGYIKKDSPNLFAEYHQKIRTEFGKDAPKFSINHRIEELNNALKRVSLGKVNDLQWDSRGPGNVGGRSRGIIIDPDDNSAGTWYIAAVGGGVWKTADSGKTWRELTSEKGSLSASYMAMAPSNHNVIYLGTGEGFGNLDALGGQGIWKTSDRGETWQQLSFTATNEFGIINRIIVDPNDENILLAATSLMRSGTSSTAGIWKSTDGGNTWMQKYSTNNRVQQIVCDPNDFKIQYASEKGKGIIKSTDSGNNWSFPSSGLESKGRIEFTVSPVNSKRLYASVDGSPSEIWYSEDKAETWKKGSTGEDFLGGQGWYDNAIVADPYNEKQFYVAGVDIYRVKLVYGGTLKVTRLTDNYGDNSDLHKGTHVDNHFFAVAKLDDSKKKYRLVGTNDGGVCYTDDNGETFTQPILGFITSQFYGVDKANGVDRYIGGMQDNSCYLSPNDPLAKDKWKFVFGGDGFDVIWNYEDENKVMLTSQFNNIAITHDGIETLYQTGWSANVDNGRTKAPFFTKLAQSKQYPDLVFAFGENGVWRTDNFGVSWSKIAMPDDFDGTSSLNEIKISLIDPSIVWTGSSLSSSGTMNVSTDFGKSFKRVSTSDDARSSLSGFATHPKDKNTAYALFSSYGNAKIMKTSDLGNNWKDISGFSNSSDGKSTNGFPDVAVYDLLVMPYDTNIIWAGTEIGIFESKDKGATWNYANNGMPPVSVYDLLVVNDEVVIGTHGRGVWSVTLPELAGYEPPVTAVPLSLLASYYFDNPKQFAKVSIEYKSNYSSVKVYLNDVLKKEFSDVSKGSSEELMLEIVTGENTIKVVSVSNGNTFKSLASVLGLPLKSAVSSYSTDFNIKITDDFFGSGFYVKLENGFDSKALQSSHPYLENSTKLLYLRNPILVSAANPDFRYDDVAIIEVGETGTSYPDPEFWDYVTVEASVDGSNWIQLEDPYDASYNANWKSIYSSESSPTKNNYVSHSINLTDFFSNDDVILIRFKLYSDEAAVSWGWIIDNLSIQSNGLSNDEYNFNKAEMSVFPNPINSNSKIELPEELKLENLNFKLYDISGKLIKSGTFDARNENVNLPFNVSEIEGGNYVFSVSSDKYLAKKKLLKK